MESQDASPQRRIAMLVDGENAQPSLLADMLREAFHYGDVTVRRIYGDWTRPGMSGWKVPLQELAFHPIQQFHHVAGKNATDCAMIVDAMDIMYSGIVDGFCLGSSDSDFTRLAIRLREEGCFVMGIGNDTTPSVLVNACHVFVPVSMLSPTRRSSVGPLPISNIINSDLLHLLKGAFTTEEAAKDWVELGIIGGRLSRLDPTFKPRAYGYRQLSQLFQGHPHLFTLKRTKSNIFVKVRDGVDWQGANDELASVPLPEDESPTLSEEDEIFGGLDEEDDGIPF